MMWTGKMSTFGGPDDMGVKPDEGLALIEPADLAEWWFGRLFLPEQPAGTTGLARRLNPAALYIAMRWNKEGTSNAVARRAIFRLSNALGTRVLFAQAADWGPAVWTQRICDMSEGCAKALRLSTDDLVNVEMIT